MADALDLSLPIEAPGINVELDRGMQAASLRYFDREGSFARAVQALLGAPMPAPQRAVYGAQSSGRESILAWRGPTETLLLCNEACVESLGSGVASCSDGCMVVQSGGLRVLRARGARVADLIARIGGQGVAPAVGEARRGRLAEVAVLAVRLQSEETLLVVERVYTEHVMNWLRISAADIA